MLLKVSDFEEVFFGLCPSCSKSETFKHRFKVRDFEELSAFSNIYYLQILLMKCKHTSTIMRLTIMIKSLLIFVILLTLNLKAQTVKQIRPPNRRNPGLAAQVMQSLSL